LQATPGSGADRAIEGPARAVHRDGKRVDDGRTEETRTASRRARIRDVGEQEQDPDVANGREDDEVRGEHQSMPAGPAGSASGSGVAMRPASASSTGRSSTEPSESRNGWHQERTRVPAMTNSQTAKRYKASRGTPSRTTRLPMNRLASG